MSSRLQTITEYAGRRALSIVFLAIGVFFMSAGPELLAQGSAAPGDSAEPQDLKIEVLEVTTGSGSKSRTREKPPLQIEVMDVSTGSGSKAVNSGDQAQPAAAPGEAAPPAPAVVAEAAKSPAEAKHEALFAALDRWHYDTLASYNYDIPKLADPFMPIQEVRGTQPVSLSQEQLNLLPPLLRLKLNQLKLVAITSLTSRPEGAWASFEDGAQNSYILRLGDRIGIDHGRIVKITPNEVWVEERGLTGTEAPKTAVIKLNVLDTEGLTRDEGQPAGALQTLSVPE